LTNFPLKGTVVHTWWIDSHEEWIKETRLDIRTGSRTQVARSEESTCREHRQNFEADRGRDAAKGI